MYLVIDSSEAETLRLYTAEAGEAWQEHAAQAVPVGQFLSVVIDSLQRIHKKVSDITGIAVLVGKGRFTATRVAVTVANTMAFSLGVPVVGVNAIDLETVIAKIQSTPVGQYVLATYSAPARIGGAASS